MRASNNTNDHVQPFIVGIGGTTREGSSSEAALHACLAAASRRGARTSAIVGSELAFPAYSPHVTMRTAEASRMVELVRDCDGLIIASPGYHGVVSGLIKNALDYLEDLRLDERPYLSERAVGCIVCAAGWQAVGTTMMTLRAIAHALRAWPTPVAAGLNTADPTFDASCLSPDHDPHPQIDLVADQVVHFARMQVSRRVVERGHDRWLV